MSAHSVVVRPESFEEKLIFHCIVWTYGYYVLGALYVLGPMLGWVLAVRQARVSGLKGLPAPIQVWIVGMLGMLLALVAGHADFNLGVGPMIKSAIGWAKGWALLPIFMIVGCGKVRLELVSRAASILGIQTLVFIPLAAMAWLIGLPGHLYVSPTSIVGGPGPEYFSVQLYGISPDSGMPRWQLFAPWAPAIGMVMCVYFFLIINEKDPRYRWPALAGVILAILGSSSRLGLMCLPLVGGVAWVFVNLGRPMLYFAAAPLALLAGLLSDVIFSVYEEFVSRFHGARADSSRVRAALGRIAVERWQNEAVVWGHGTVERGPHLVEFMPIGSHHTWFGLLFVKGVVGVISLAVPMIWSFLNLLVRLVGREGGSPQVRTAFRMIILMFIYTFAENLEILSYLYWPALIVIGMAHNEISVPRKAPVHRLTFGGSLHGHPSH